MTRPQQIKQWTATIETVVGAYLRMREVCDAAIEVGMMDIEGPMFEAMWKSFEEMLDLADHDGWINWHIYENGCGKKGMGTSEGKVKTARDLAKIIVDTLEKKE